MPIRHLPFAFSLALLTFQPTLEAKPVARWALDELGGTAARETFSGLHGQLEGNATWVTDSEFGRVLSLDGYGDAVRVVNHATLNPQRLALSGWIWLSSSGSGTRHILSKDFTEYRPHQRAWQFRVRSDRSLELIVFNSTGHGAARGGSIATNRWVHVAGTWDGDTIRVFVDAVEVAQTPFAGTLRQHQSNAVFIGRSENSNSGFFKGKIADFRIFDEALEWAEIRKLMDHPHLIGHWPLTDTADPLRDEAGRNPGTLQGNPEFSADLKRGSSLNFDGSGDAVALGPLGLEPRRITLSAWIRTKAADYRAYQIFSKDRTAYATQRAWQFRVNKRNYLEFIAFNSAGQATIILGTTPLDDDEWHHVAATVDGTNLRLFVDGQPDGNPVPFAAQLAQGTVNDAFIGRSENSSAGYFVGSIHDVRLYDRALSAGEVETLAGASAGVWNDWLQSEAEQNEAQAKAGDFSYSGYHHGERIWPEIIVQNTTCNPGTGGRHDDGRSCNLGGETGSCRLFNVQCYGASPDGSGNSLPAAQEAIHDAVSYRTDPSQRLVIYFPPGTYTMRQMSSGTGLSVTESRIVLKGASQYQTTLQFHPDSAPLPLNNRPFLIRFHSDANETSPCLRSVFANKPQSPGQKLGDIVQASPRGSFSVVVGQLDEPLAAGSWVTVALEQPCNGPGSCPQFEELVSPRTADLDAWTRGAWITERHQVAQTAPAGPNVSVIFEDPLHLDVAAQDWVLARYRTIEEVGLEDLRLEGGWKESYCHNPTYATLPQGRPGCTDRACLDAELKQYHDAGWSGVCFDGVVNGWIDSVRLAKWNRGIHLFDTSSSSVLRTRFVGNPLDLLPRPADVICRDRDADAVEEHGHESIRVRGGTGNLVGYTYEHVPFWHGPSVSFAAASTVFWHYEYSGTTAFDGHGTCPYATLIDTSRGGVADRKSGGPTKGQPNHLERFVLWNFTSTGPDGDAPPFTFWDDQDPTLANFVEPVVVGYQESGRTLDPSTLGLNESPGSFVAPQSLYEAQLEMRLGQPPRWLCHLKACGEPHALSCSGFEVCSVLP